MATSVSTTALSGPRAIIRSWLYKADIRGLPYDRDSNKVARDIEIRVVGQTEEPGGFVGATPVLTVGRGEQPFAIGHLPDHTMRYSTSTLDRSTTEKSELAGWIEDVAQDSAEAWAGWASPVAELEVCNSACDENTDREILWVKNAGTCLYPRHYACVDGLANVEGSLTMNRNMLFEDEPETGSGPNLVRYQWTNIRSFDQSRCTRRQAIYRWVRNVAVHEFGHAFGLADRYHPWNNPDPGYVGIMKTIEKRSKTIKQDDIDSLRAIYKTHTRNHGW